jgi:hypothetical protein
MARISTYPIDNNISNNDMLLGTDKDDSDSTVNFKIDEVAAYIKSKIRPYSTFSFKLTRNSSGAITAAEFMNDTTLTFAFSGSSGHIDMTASSNISNNKVSLQATAMNSGSGQVGDVFLLQPKQLAGSGTALTRLIPIKVSDGSLPVEIEAYVEFKIYN